MEVVRGNGLHDFDRLTGNIDDADKYLNMLREFEVNVNAERLMHLVQVDASKCMISVLYESSIDAALKAELQHVCKEAAIFPTGKSTTIDIIQSDLGGRSI